MMLRSVAAALLLTGLLPGQTLLRDIRPGLQAGNPGSSPQSFATVGTRTFFSASDGALGTELWCSDGTSNGTRLVRDLRQGPGDSRPLSLCAFGNQILFAADDGASGYEPWISDGTSAGTRLVADLLPGPEGRAPFFQPAGAAFFIVTQSLEANGTRVWKSDGTPAGTSFVGAFPYSDGAPARTAALGARLVLVATNQLWISDGTSAGTIQLANLGSPFRAHNFLAVHGGRIYFEAEDATHGNELWVSDGTVAGTGFLAELTPGTASTRFFGAASVGASLLLGVDDMLVTSALWKTDGTAAGTQVVRTYARAGFGRAPYPLGVLGTKLLFLADDGIVGSEIWTSDGTPAGTQLLYDLAPGNGGCELIAYFGATTNGLAFFAADDQTHGQELWCSDGTPLGTRLVADLENGPAGSDPLAGAPLGTKLIFAPSVGPLGTEPWITDGSSANTTLLREIRPPQAQGCDAYGFASAGTAVHFVADNGTQGREPWVTDGTPAGTRLLADLVPGLAGSGLLGWTTLRGSLLSFANLGTNHAYLVTWDERSASLRTLADPAGSAVVGICTQTLLGDDRLYFRYATVLPQSGSLWRTDGTSAGTTRLWQVSGDLVPFAHVAGKLWFGRSTNGSSYELWCGDGTQPGSVRVLTLQTNVNQSPASDFVAHEGRVYFLASNGTRTDLWVSDGTANGTLTVTDATFGTLDTNGSPGRGAPRLASFRGALWFCTQLGSPKQRLWRSDGTRAGSLPFRDFGDTCHPLLTKLDTRLLFAASDAATGRELWSTDGTQVGTAPLPELVPGPIGGLEFTESITPLGAGNVAVLAAHDGAHGLEVYATDGLVWLPQADLAPGAASSSPTNFTRVGDRVVFVADDGTQGREPFVVDARSLGIGFADPVAGGCPGHGDRIPRLRASGVPRSGNLDFAMTLAEAAPSAGIAWLVGATSQVVVLEGGCSSVVGFPNLIVSASTDGRGAGRLPLAIPSLANLLGSELWVQVAVADPEGAYKSAYALSDGLRILIGR